MLRGPRWGPLRYICQTLVDIALEVAAAVGRTTAAEGQTTGATRQLKGSLESSFCTSAPHHIPELCRARRRRLKKVKGERLQPRQTTSVCGRRVSSFPGRWEASVSKNIKKNVASEEIRKRPEGCPGGSSGHIALPRHVLRVRLRPVDIFFPDGRAGGGVVRRQEPDAEPAEALWDCCKRVGVLRPPGQGVVSAMLLGCEYITCGGRLPSMAQKVTAALVESFAKGIFAYYLMCSGIWWTTAGGWTKLSG